MKRTILVGLLLGVALAHSLRGQSPGGSVALRLECFVSGPAQVSTFRFPARRSATLGPYLFLASARNAFPCS